MQLSTRNQLRGTVRSVVTDQIMAKVTIDVGGQTLTSIITREAVDELGIKQGDEVFALVKASSVMVMK